MEDFWTTEDQYVGPKLSGPRIRNWKEPTDWDHISFIQPPHRNIIRQNLIANALYGKHMTNSYSFLATVQ